MLLDEMQEKIAPATALGMKLRALGMAELAVFGSVARREETAASDIDFLVQLNGPPDYRRFLETNDLLEAEFQRKVDLVRAGLLKPSVEKYALRDLIRVL